MYALQSPSLLPLEAARGRLGHVLSPLFEDLELALQCFALAGGFAELFVVPLSLRVWTAGCVWV